MTNSVTGTGAANMFVGITASIIFDGNDPITTPPVWNILGDVPPLAAVLACLPGQLMAGAPLSCLVTLTNHGYFPVTNMVLTNALLTGLSVVNARTTAGFVRQQSFILGGTDWVPVTNAVSVAPGRMRLTNSPPVGTRFFRLIRSP